MAKNKKRLTTKERIAAFCGKIEEVQLSEIDWGKPQGKEIWKDSKVPQGRNVGRNQIRPQAAACR